MHHRVGPLRAHLHAHFSRDRTPLIVVDPGDSVSFTVPDVGWGLEPPTSTTAPRRKVEPRDPATDDGPCLCGPVAVRGAMPGDTLRIDIEQVAISPWGWTYAGRGLATPALNSALRIADAPLTLLNWSIDPSRDEAVNQHGHRVALRPFPGTIGLAPDERRAIGWVPRQCGGNMDCRELCAGSTLLLPVMIDGAMLSAGDGHAAQGDGEIAGTAIECGLEELRVRVDIRRGMRISGPRVHTAPDADGRRRWLTLGFGDKLEDAAHAAMNNMLDLMAEQLGPGLPRAELLALAASCVNLHITQMVNPRVGVHAEWVGV